MCKLSMKEIIVDNNIDLAKLIFIDNTDDKPISLEIAEGCDNNKELFYVCVEVLTSGLALLYGNNEGKVDLSQISLENLEYCRLKLEKARIAFAIQIIPCDTVPVEVSIGEANFETEKLQSDLPLCEYAFHIDNYPQHYVIRFNVIT